MYSGDGKLTSLLLKLQEHIIQPIAYLLYSLAVLLFFWGLFEFMMSLQQDKSDKREAGKRHMLYAIIGFVVMLSVKGIISMIANFIGADLPVNIN